MAVPISAALAAVVAGRVPATLPSSVAGVEVRDIGTLALPTGRVVACDPVVFGDPEPFALGVLPGDYPVRVALARHARPGWGAGAAGVWLEFAPDAPDRFEMALRPGEDVADLAPGHIFGYRVDSGTGCLLDAAWAEEVVELRALDLDAAHRLVRSAYHYPGEPRLVAWGGVPRMAVVGTGGDGSFASYWGYSGSAAVCLVTDFRLLVG